VVERRNQTVVGMARSMMKAKKLPSFLWGEAVTTAVYVLNRTFTRSVDGRTPYEAWHRRKPSVEHFRVFGCIAHVKSARPFLRKLDDRSTPMVFIGYEPGSKAYRVYDPATRRVHVTRDVVFDETASWVWEEKDGGTSPSQDFEVEYTVDTPSNNSTARPPPTPARESEEEESWDTSDQGGTASPRTPPPPPATEERSIEFATPPAAPDPEQLDASDGGEPHRYRRMSDLLGLGNTAPGLAERLLLTTA
jgi:hypothetical protein